MTRHQGSAGVALVELSSRKQQHYIVRTDIKAEQSENGDIVSFFEKIFPYKPTMAEVKDFVFSVINAKTDEKILGGFVWNGVNVWLSAENQRNFSEAQRLGNVPVKFKLGEGDDGSPIYHTFSSTEELDGFYHEAAAYIQQCLQEGWNEKDGVDFSEYERLLGE